jgi:hypothetical protein
MRLVVLFIVLLALARAQGVICALSTPFFSSLTFPPSDADPAVDQEAQATAFDADPQSSEDPPQGSEGFEPDVVVDTTTTEEVAGAPPVTEAPKATLLKRVLGLQDAAQGEQGVLKVRGVLAVLFLA